MASKELQMFERDTTVTPRKLREVGYVPATIYGKNVEPLAIQVKAHDFELALAKGVRQFTLEGFGQKIEAEVKQIQKMATKETVLHAEFVVPSTEGAKAKGKAKAQKAEEAPRAEEKQPEQSAEQEAPAEEPKAEPVATT